MDAVMSVDLAVRFLLELCALTAAAYCGATVTWVLMAAAGR